MQTYNLVIATAIALLVAAPAASAAHSVSATSGTPNEGAYTMNVKVDKFLLVDFAGKTGDAAHKKGEGHIHYLVNDKDACSAGKADCAAPTDYATTKTSFNFKNLKAGDVLRAELVLSDHSASGTDSAGTLDGSRVLSGPVQVAGAQSKGSPGAGPLVAVLVLGLAAMVSRRRQE